MFTTGEPEALAFAEVALALVAVVDLAFTAAPAAAGASTSVIFLFPISDSFRTRAYKLGTKFGLQLVRKFIHY
jgi:hypothetical protein